MREEEEVLEPGGRKLINRPDEVEREPEDLEVGGEEHQQDLLLSTSCFLLKQANKKKTSCPNEKSKERDEKASLRRTRRRRRRRTLSDWTASRKFRPWGEGTTKTIG